MADYCFSASQNAFYPVELREIYEKSGTWPADAKPVKAAVFDEFSLQAVPAGKMRGVTTKGQPIWKNIPALTADELAEEMTVKKQDLSKEAEKRIAILQDAADLDIATEDEVAALTAWRKYRVLLSRIDTTAVNINWPKVPQ